LLAIVRYDKVCARLMTIPGVGPVVSLAFSATIDIPARFTNSKAVGPALGLTPILNQSGESSRVGRISRYSDNMMRTLLYEAAQVMLTRTTRWSWLKAWAMNVARRRGLQRPSSHWRADWRYHAAHLERWHGIPLDEEKALATTWPVNCYSASTHRRSARFRGQRIGVPRGRWMRRVREDFSISRAMRD
jgi:hypothetical protein